MGASAPPLIMAPVWSDELMVTGLMQDRTGQIPSDALKDLLSRLDNLTTHLAADYLTANPPKR